MSTRKTLDEQIEVTQEKIKQEETRLKELLQKQKEKAGKDKAKRLTERGKILESFIAEAESLTNEQIKTFLKRTITTDYALDILNGLKKKNGETPIVKSADTERRNATEPQAKISDGAKQTSGVNNAV